ncbi:hypothetical protein [Bowmanella pacifica]|uniref:Uncharacterized protein n=1 Tax=Bowmanella pacifica TaxID=502051 RepID=A0A917Z2Y0_9ALTE|nr:hypothetical protein [Bowmanella pacifica]GGO73411.1 hypothetical protein GCM10010982_33880 [Bowmanella pacifica]
MQTSLLRKRTGHQQFDRRSDDFNEKHPLLGKFRLDMVDSHPILLTVGSSASNNRPTF